MRVSWPALRIFALALGGALALGSAASAQTPSSVWTIPGTVNNGGLNNTRFVSDLAVTNPGSVPTQATISFIPANGTTPQQVLLNAGQTVVYRNVLDSLWGAQGAGATQVASDLPLLIRARTYNTAASGTYGVALPVFADERLLSPGKTADTLWISQSADGSSGYRTNIAVVFPDAGGGAATVTVYGADGVEIGSQDFSLDAAGFQQFLVGGFAGAVSVARAQVEVRRGRAAGYSVVVDNVTGDSSLFSFEELPTGYQDVIVNGVARANGRNNTFFRTDGRFFNPTDEDAVVKVSFHASGSSNPAPISGTFTVGAGRILDVVDVLGSLLDLPVGSAGAMRFETDASVGILCRTSNVDPLGVKPGTYGAQQKPTPLLSFLMSADAGAVVTGIRENATFRTNIGFAAGSDGADYGLTLKSAAGATVATATGSLGPFGWTQPNVQLDLFPGTTIPDDATLQVKVTSGSVDVFDSSIDNASGDPVVTPIMPLPVNIPSSATIGPQGGSVRSDDGRITLKVPAGALAAPVTVVLTPEASGVAGALGSAYALTPSTLPLVKPALLVFRAAGGPAPALGLVTVSLAVKTGSGTFVAMGGRVDPAAGTLSVPIASTSPSAASVGAASARGALADAPTIVVPVSNVVLDPGKPAVLTDGSVRLKIMLQWPPSAGARPPGYALALSPEDESALVISFTEPTIGKFSDNTGGTVLYTAPHRIMGADDLAEFKMTVRSAFAFQMTLPGIVTIVRRDWIIETDFTLSDIPCEQDIFPYQLSWKNFQTSKFRINVGGSLSLYDPSEYIYDVAVWKLCPPDAIAIACIQAGACKWYTTLTRDPDGVIDLTVKFSAFSNFDFEKLEFNLDGTSTFESPGATLSGGTFPMDNYRVEPMTVALPISLWVPIGLEGEWYQDDNGGYPANMQVRHRIYSVDTP